MTGALTHEKLAAMNVGDELDCPGLLMGIDRKTGVKARLVEKSDNLLDFVFMLSYKGVQLGSVAVMHRKGVLLVESL